MTGRRAAVWCSWWRSAASRTPAAINRTVMLMTTSLVLFGAVAGAVPRPPDTREAVIRRLNDDEVDAFLRRDTAVLARLWSPDMVVTNPLNQLVTKDDVLGMIRSGFLVITSYDRQLEYIRAYGNMVVVAGRETVTWGGRMPFAGRAQQLRFTAVWMVQDGQWLEIARHANVVP